MLDPQEVTKTDIGFTWITDEGQPRVWLTSRMEAFIKTGAVPLVAVDIDLDYAKFVKARCGIEKHRLDRLTPAAIAHNPVIFVTFAEGQNKLVDGNHRFLKAAMLGWSQLPAYIFDLEQSDQFEVYVPPFMHDFLRSGMDRFSGIA